MILNLGANEREHGLSYVGFSRATRVSDVGIVGGIQSDRLCSKIAKMKKLKDRVVEDKRLDALYKATAQKLLFLRLNN